MNQEQTLGIVRAVLMSLGTILATKGVIGSADVSTDVTIAMTAIGAVSALGSLVWGIYSKTKANQIANAAKLPNVVQIVTDQKTADATPNTKVVGPANLAPTN